MLLDHWDTLPPDHREQALGRRAADGAPLTGGSERTPVDLAAVRPDGVPVIAANAHIRLAATALAVPGARGVGGVRRPRRREPRRVRRPVPAGRVTSGASGARVEGASRVRPFGWWMRRVSPRAAPVPLASRERSRSQR
ncbi:hypothetical protein [Streptomyces sp. NPDC056049]|uniref:hypothetical protein n=1 Tax=Streptomyces sp. NPDC056049 TaxID=3345693 RepID=UPI0035DF153D